MLNPPQHMLAHIHTYTHVLTCKYSLKTAPPHACTQYTGIPVHRCTHTHTHTHTGRGKESWNVEITGSHFTSCLAQGSGGEEAPLHPFPWSFWGRKPLLLWPCFLGEWSFPWACSSSWGLRLQDGTPKDNTIGQARHFTIVMARESLPCPSVCPGHPHSKAAGFTDKGLRVSQERALERTHSDVY